MGVVFIGAVVDVDVVINVVVDVTSGGGEVVATVVTINF